MIWDFSTVFGKANCFYLNQLEADFDVSLGGFEIFFSPKSFCDMVSFYFFWGWIYWQVLVGIRTEFGKFSISWGNSVYDV